MAPSPTRVGRLMSAQTRYPRFSISQRIQHWVMLISFTALATAGLPQRYALAPQQRHSSSVG